MKNIEPKKGEKINGFTIRAIFPVERKTGGSRKKAEVACHCGKVFTTLLSPIVTGIIKSCGCSKIKGYTKEGVLRRCFQGYQQAAKKSKRVFEICFKLFLEISTKPCFYCGEEGGNCITRRNKDGSPLIVRYNGIDRIDSNKGYLINNCVACCYNCNSAKSDLTQEQFIKWVFKCADFLRNKPL